ncbi:MAG: uroporphyrinogen decarboxylase [Gammaproteobacteria bacterium]
MTAKLKNDRLIRALLRQPVDATPVWIMRQAGRYLPEYRRVREQAGSFLNLCKTPELACEVTLQPLHRFDLDAAILFSDILTIPDAMGLGLEMIEKYGPRFNSPVRSRSDIEKLRIPDMHTDLGYVMDAVQTVKRELDNRVPLIGFAGSPWTVGTYMVEGGPSKEYGIIKGMLYGEPASLHDLLATVADATTDYLNAQIEAGVNAVQIFDTWGGILTPDAYREFSLNYMRRIVDGLKRDVDGERIPVILFSKGCAHLVEEIAAAGADAVGVDWTVDIGDIRRRIDGRTAVQGNLDPAVLYASPEVIKREVDAVLRAWGAAPGHVFNLGHGIHPQIDPDNVAILVDSVHELSGKYKVKSEK